MVDVDVAIAGAGTAGAAVAALCARRGLSVICVDRQPLGAAGAHWVNAVPGWCFDVAGVERPTVPELRPDTGACHLMAGWGPTRVVVDERDVLEIDMRRLVDRLQRIATDAGAELRGDTRVDRVTASGLRTEGDLIRARWVVDARGLRRGAQRTDLCVAAQEVRELADRAGAQRYFDQRSVPLGDTLTHAGVSGGYSILNVKVEGDEVVLLTGTMVGDDILPAGALLDRFVGEQAWIGPLIHGGRRAIPVGMPEPPVQRGVARVGDSAGQVFAAHGSGVGVQLLAAHTLSSALAGGRGVRGYRAEWERTWQPWLRQSAHFARFSRQLSTEDLQGLMRSGIMSAETVRPQLEQRHLRLDRPLARALASGIVREPRLIARLVPVLGRMLVAAAKLRGR